MKKEATKKALGILKGRGVAGLKDGAWIIDFKKHGAKSLDVAVICNGNGTSNYLLRDVGAAIQRFDEYHFDEMLYVVFSEQEAH